MCGEFNPKGWRQTPIQGEGPITDDIAALIPTVIPSEDAFGSFGAKPVEPKPKDTPSPLTT